MDTKESELLGTTQQEEWKDAKIVKFCMKVIKYKK